MSLAHNETQVLCVIVHLSDYLNSQKEQTTSNYSTQWNHTSRRHLLTTPNLVKICVALTVLICLMVLIHSASPFLWHKHCPD